MLGRLFLFFGPITTVNIGERFNNAFKSPAASAANSTPGQWYASGRGVRLIIAIV